MAVLFRAVGSRSFVVPIIVLFLIFFCTGKEPGSKECAIFQKLEEAAFMVRAPGSWLAIGDPDATRCPLPLSLLRDRRMVLANRQRLRRDAHSWNYIAKMSIRVAPFGSGPVERVRGVSNPAWAKWNSCKFVSRILINSHGGGGPKTPKP